MNAFLFVLLCADGSDDVGSRRGEGMERRFGAHQAGTDPGDTRLRRPVTLVYAEDFQRITDVIAAESPIKGWSRARKEALIRGDWDAVIGIGLCLPDHRNKPATQSLAVKFALARSPEGHRAALVLALERLSE